MKHPPRAADLNYGRRSERAPLISSAQGVVVQLRPRGVLHVVVDLEPEQLESMQNGFEAEVRLGSGEVTAEFEMLLPEMMSDVLDRAA